MSPLYENIHRRFLRLGRDRSKLVRRASKRKSYGVEALEPRMMLTGTLTLIQQFETWDANPQIIPSTDVAGITYYPGNGTLVLADSEINENPQFVGDNVFETSLDGQQLVRAVSTGNSEPTGITYNAKDGHFYVSNDDTKEVTRYDLDFNELGSVDTSSFGSNDPEGITSDPSTGYLYVAGGIRKRVDVLDMNFVHLETFFVSEIQDPEGIAFDPVSNHLFLVSSPDLKIAEYDLSGNFIEVYSLRSLSPRPNSPQGITSAPSTDNPALRSLYIADGEVDNGADGRVYEVRIDGAGLPNNPPVFDQPSYTFDNVPEDSIGTVIGSVSATDPDGDTPQYAIIAGNGEGKFSIGSSSGDIQVAAALDFEGTSAYTLTVEVSDGRGGTDTAAVNVSVQDVDEPPVFAADPYNFNPVAETASVGTAAGTVVAADPEGSSVTYGITAGNDDGKFAIDQVSGQITTAATLDFETTPSYALTVQASDGSSEPVSVLVNIPVGDVTPQIASLNPTTGPVGTAVTIIGTNFTGATVAFNGTPATITVDSDTQITATVPAGATTGLISVTTNEGTGTSATDFIVRTAPQINSFTPTSGPVGTEVILVGSGFTGVTEVSFNGTSAGFQFDSDTQVRTTVPVGASSGPISITTDLGIDVSAQNFTVTIPAPVLTFNPIHDAHGKSSSSSRNYGDVDHVRLRFGSTSYEGFLKFDVSGLAGPVQSAMLRLYVIDGGPDGGEIYSVSNNYDGTGTPWEEAGLTWSNAPQISGNPLDSVGAVAPGEWVEFDVSAAVLGEGIHSFGLKNSSSNSVFYSSIEGVNPPELIVEATSATFPQIASFTPASGVVGAEVTVVGANFLGVTEVTFNGTVATNVTIDGDSQLRAVVPDGATSGSIAVTNADGTTISQETFTVLAAPSIASFTPTSGPVGTEVTLTGTAFTNVTDVSFNGTAATSFTVDSDTQLRASVPTAATTGPITLTNSLGSDTSTNDFTVTVAPPIVTFNPTDDAHGKSNGPSNNYGEADHIRIREGSTTYHSYLKFDVSGLAGLVQSAKVRLYVVDASNDGGMIYSVSNNYQGTATPWGESGLTWNNAPAINGSAWDSAGAVAVGEWVEFDVSGSISGNGIYSFALSGNSTNSVMYSSTEGSNAPELVVETTPGTLLQISSSAPLTDSPQSGQRLDDGQLATIVDEAIARLRQSAGPNAAMLLAGVSFEIVDLPGNQLGRTLAGAIQIDVDAAGYGWFIDATPADDWEFTYDENSQQLSADPRSPAAGRIDLLTVVMHEFGHLLGHEHSDSDDLMSAELTLGTRRLPAPHALNDFFYFGDLMEKNALDKFFNLLGR